ncbi:MAG TPA: PLP-dependent aminotransferase family protein [Anaerolineae bacterium]|nr:PLP-dependent aminotransferase family protein [Anaerolineae bacterium]
MTDLSHLYAARANDIQPSAIRKLAHLVKQPGIISFAGGWPAPELFPVSDLAQISADMWANEGSSALQYGPTPGDERLRNWLVNHNQTVYGLDLTLDNLIITSGAQQGLFLLGLLLLNEGDTIVVEAPSYVGGLGTFQIFNPNMVGIPMDNEGLRTDLLEEQLIAGLRPKFLYTIPEFQNPSGISMSLPRRQHLIQLAEEYDFLIVEDGPYIDLRFDGIPTPPIYALDKNKRTIFLSSFSKTLAPVRLGWVVGPSMIVDKLAIGKQSIDLCTPSLTQTLVYHFCDNGHLPAQLAQTCHLYRQKRDIMLAALTQYMPIGVTWTNPEGGLFIWVTLPEDVNADELFYEAIEAQVAFVIGSAFYPKGQAAYNTLRLSFATAPLDQITTGIQRLAQIIPSRSTQPEPFAMPSATAI